MLYLYDKGAVDYWYRLDVDTIWSFVAGDPLSFSTFIEGKGIFSHEIGNDFASGQYPLLVIPAGTWRRQSTQGAWSLATCMYTPGFEYEHLLVADPAWVPGEGEPELIFPGEKWKQRAERTQ